MDKQKFLFSEINNPDSWGDEDGYFCFHKDSCLTKEDVVNYGLDDFVKRFEYRFDDVTKVYYPKNNQAQGK